MKLRLKLVALFALLVYTTTFGQADSELRNKANDLFQSEKYSEATQLYLQLLSLQPKDVELNFRYGVCLLHQSANKSQAIRYLSYVVKEKPNDSEPYFYLGKAYHLGYQFDQATKNYDIYISKAGPKGKFVADAKRAMQMSSNGKKLLSNTGEIHVLERQEVNYENFYRGYNLENIGGSIIQAMDFQSKIDKKKGHKPIVHLHAGADLIYFSSYGETDNLNIYVVRRLPNGNFGVPQLIKGEVNTPFDEDFPFMHPNGKELYFSSKGHNSMGGYDIFKATFDLENNQFIAVENIDFAVSSPDDDLLYLVDEQYKYAYFASNRQSADGKIHLYKVAVDRFPTKLVILKGSFDSDINPEYKNLSIEVFDYQTNRKIGRYQTNESGEYVVVVPKGGKYVFKSNSSQFKGAFSQVIEVPHLEEVRPLRQYAKHFTKGVGTDVQFINAFDELVSNPQEVIAEALRLRGELQPNERPIEDVELAADQPVSTLGKTAQRVGLPDWNMPTLFAHVDGLVSKYNSETEKQQNLKEIQNALIYQEYQKIEQIDQKIIDLSGQFKDAKTNVQIRDIEQQLDGLKTQRSESVRLIQTMESNRDAIFSLYRKIATKEQYSVDHMNQVIEQLHQSQKMGEEAFIASLEKNEKEIKAVLKDPVSVYKSILAEKTTVDSKVEQYENLLKTNSSRLRELKKQLAEKLLESEQAKAKFKPAIESQIERIESEISEIEGNNDRVVDQLTESSKTQDSLIQMVLTINRMEQFKGTPVSSKMLTVAAHKFQSSPVEKGNVVFKGEKKVLEVEEDEYEPVIAQTTSSSKNSISKSNIYKNDGVSSIDSVVSEDDEQSNQLASSEDWTTERQKSTSHPKDVIKPIETTAKEEQRVNTPAESKLVNQSDVNPTRVSIPKEETKQEDVKAPTVHQETSSSVNSNVVKTVVTQANEEVNSPESIVTEQKAANKQTYRFVTQLSATDKELINDIDPSYIKRVEKLEARTLNGAEQRVLIDLHRKYLDKVEEQQAAIQFGDRSPKDNREIVVLASVNEKLTQSIRVLNNLLSSDGVEEVRAEELKEVPKQIPTAKSIEESKSPDIATSKSSTENSLKNTEDPLDSPRGETKQATPLSVKQGQNTEEQKQEAVQSYQREEESVVEIPAIDRKTKVFEINKEATAWSSLQHQIDAIQRDRVEQEQFLSNSSNKKEKASIEKMLNELKNQEAELILKREEMIYESLDIDHRLENSDEAVQMQKANVLSVKSAALEREKNIQNKAQLALEKVELAEEIIVMQEAQRKMDFIQKTSTGGVSILNQEQLKSNMLYFEVQKRTLEEEIETLQGSPKKKKKEQEQQRQMIDALATKVDDYTSIISMLNKQLKAEEKYKPATSSVDKAPSFEEEHAILSSKAYEEFAIEKAKLMDLAYQLQIENISLDNKRDEVQQVWKSAGEQSNAYKTGLVEIGELENRRKLTYKTYEEQMNKVSQTVPTDATQRSHYENLAARGMNPIVHKELDQPFVDLKQKGIAFENSKGVRSEMNLDMPKGLVYRVQVGAFKNAIPAHLFREFTPVTSEEMPNSQVKRYVAGYFSSDLMAQSARDEIRDLGYQDAFVIAYCDGARLTIAEAKELEQSGRCKPQLIEQITFEINRSNISRAKIIDRSNIEALKVNPSDYNRAEGAASADAMDGMQGLYFTVQVGVYNRPAPAERFMGQHPLYTLRLPNGQIRYSVGAYTSLAQARAKEKVLREVGLRDAYVVAYYQGERIAVYKAMDLMDKGVVPSIIGMQKSDPTAPIMTIKEETKVFDQKKRATWNLEERKVQLISKDSFNAIPVDFLNRFRSVAYFYFDTQSGQVKSQSVDASHYLVEMEQLKKYFYVQEDTRNWRLDPTLAAYVVTDKSPKVRASFADILLRHSNRIEIKELERGTQFTIFVVKGEKADFFENALKEAGVSYNLVKEFTE